MKNYKDTRYMRSMISSSAYRNVNNARHGSRLSLVLTSAVLSLLGLLILSVLFLSFYPAQKDLKVRVGLAVVPGAGITRSGDPSPALRLRLDKALEIYGEGYADKIFISGKADEVRIMRNYLAIHSVEPEAIVEDESSDNTYDTVQNCADYLELARITNGVVFVSQRYHIPRITLLAHRQKLTNAYFVSTRRKNIGMFAYQWAILRESLALYRTLLTGH